MAMTYNSLVAQILSYVERSDQSTVDQVPSFIANAQQKACRESKVIGLEQYVTGTLTQGESVMPKPARWRRTITFNYGTGDDSDIRNQIRLRSYEFCRTYWPNATETSAPQFYCDYGYTHFLIAPTPAEDYPFELAYLELPQPLSAGNQTNWFTDYAPDLLLFGSLLQAIPFLKNDERIPVWEAKYKQSLDSLNSQDDQRLLDRASNRSSD